MKNSIKLHLGSGTNLIKGWENLDLEPRKGAILCDLSKPLPYKTDSVDKIFTEHVIEHLEKKDGNFVLEECFRVLKPGGILRIGWPTFDLLIKAYLLRNKKYKDYILPHLPEQKTNNWDEILSDCLFSWEHKYAYTRKHMTLLLKRIGFVKIKRQNFMQSDYGIKFDVRNDPATGYLECQKPIAKN